MKTNVGSSDRWIRVIIGLILLSLPFWLDTSWRWWGLIGIIPLVTGLAGRCPVYNLLHITTCKTNRSR